MNIPSPLSSSSSSDKHLKMVSYLSADKSAAFIIIISCCCLLSIKCSSDLFIGTSAISLSQPADGRSNRSKTVVLHLAFVAACTSSVCPEQRRLIAFCVAPMEMHHFPDVVLPVPHPRLLRLTSMSTIVPAIHGDNIITNSS